MDHLRFGGSRFPLSWSEHNAGSAGHGQRPRACWADTGPATCIRGCWTCVGRRCAGVGTGRSPWHVGLNGGTLGRSQLMGMIRMDTHAPMRERGAALPGDTAFLQALFDQLAERCRDTVPRAPRQPFVTLSYAQSIDGSIAARPSLPVALSSEESFDMTHRLRSRHDALLVGINTVLADDPRLTVRRCTGDNPRPVVLDSRLRFPVDARLLTHPDRYPLILTTDRAGPEDIRRLEARGAVVRVLARDDAGRVDLAAALRCLGDMGIRTLMVEGGARVIGSFLGRRLVDHCVITVAPRLIGGVKALDGPCSPDDLAPLSIIDCRYEPLGGDLIVHGSLRGSGTTA